MAPRSTFAVVAAVVAVTLSGCAPPPEAPWSWSPGASDLLYSSNRTGNAEIYLLPAGADGAVNLTNHPANENWPVWSPDGRRIAFQSNRDGNLDVWVMDADGSDPVRLTDDPAHDYLPSWSRDGTRLTFASWRREPGDGDDAVHLYVMNADGSDPRRLLADSPGTSTAAAWVPGGGFVLGRRPDDGGTDLFVVEDDGAIRARLTYDAASNGAASLSPDGGLVAFHADRGETSDLAVVGLDGSDRRTVLRGGRHWYPRWSPDGRWLVFTSSVPGSEDRDLDVLAVPLEGGDPVVLAGGPGREAEGSWRPWVP